MGVNPFCFEDLARFLLSSRRSTCVERREESKKREWYHVSCGTMPQKPGSRRPMAMAGHGDGPGGLQVLPVAAMAGRH